MCFYTIEISVVYTMRKKKTHHHLFSLVANLC